MKTLTTATGRVLTTDGETYTLKQAGVADFQIEHSAVSACIDLCGFDHNDDGICDALDAICDGDNAFLAALGE